MPSASCQPCGNRRQQQHHGRQTEACGEDGPTKTGKTRRRDCATIRAAGTTTLSGKCDGTTGSTAANATDAANATEVGPAGDAAGDDATAADANDGTSATNAAGDATHGDAHAAATCKYDGIPTTVWCAKPAWADLLTRRGEF